MPRRQHAVIPLAVVALGITMLGFQLGRTAPAAAQNEAPAQTQTDEPAPDAGGAAATDGASDEARDEQLRQGAQAYSQICASCHQPGGIGVSGQFPPLKDNPHTADADYVRAVVATGRAGQIVVNGVTYDGIMPSFSTLPDDDVEAIIAYIQNDFVAPAVAVTPQAGPIAGTELPALTNMGALMAYVIAGAGALLVLGPRITSVNDRLSFPWLDAWLKTAVIVASVILLTVVVPDWAVRNEHVASLSGFAQDLIGVALWLAGLGAVLWGLWYAHRESRL